MEEGKWSSAIKKFDIFAQEIEILFEDNRRTLQTHCGVVFFAIMISILFTFGAFKCRILLEYEDIVVQEPDL